MEFHALPLIPEVGAALAGFATLAGVLRPNAMEADAIFDVVLYSLIALVFSLLAILPEATEGETLRILAGALGAVSSLSFLRNAMLVRRALKKSSQDQDRKGFLLGWLALSLTLLAPLVAFVVAFSPLSARSALLYELCVLNHLAVAICLLLYVVWRNFALGHKASSGDGA